MAGKEINECANPKSAARIYELFKKAGDEATKGALAAANKTIPCTLRNDGRHWFVASCEKNIFYHWQNSSLKQMAFSGRVSVHTYVWRGINTYLLEARCLIGKNGSKNHYEFALSASNDTSEKMEYIAIVRPPTTEEIKSIGAHGFIGIMGDGRYYKMLKNALFYVTGKKMPIHYNIHNGMACYLKTI